MSERYEPREIERKWQQVWEGQQAFRVPNPEPGEDAGAKTYVVEMLPYPSGVTSSLDSTVPSPGHQFTGAWCR